VFTCNRGSATLQLGFAEGRVIEWVIQKALRTGDCSQLLETTLRAIALTNCNRAVERNDRRRTDQQQCAEFPLNRRPLPSEICSARQRVLCAWIPLICAAYFWVSTWVAAE